jgi:hypothetical protein
MCGKVDLGRYQQRQRLWEEIDARDPLAWSEALYAGLDGSIDEILLRVEGVFLVEVRRNKREHCVCALQDLDQVINR